MALSGIARRGMTDSFDGHVARAYYLLILALNGDDDDALAVIERELCVAHPNFINVAVSLDQKVVLLARRGRSAEAREALGLLEAHLAGLPASRLSLGRERALAAVLISEGRFAEALARREAAERSMRESGAASIAFDRTFFAEVELEAVLGLLRREGLSSQARIRARTAATWLTERGVFDFACLGHRALALLDHAEGRPREASRALRRALSLSSVNASPRHRWLCLEAARDLDVITLDQEAEAAELAAEGRFAHPAG
jgi:hypothetical protein